MLVKFSVLLNALLRKQNSTDVDEKSFPESSKLQYHGISHISQYFPEIWLQLVLIHAPFLKKNNWENM